MIKKIFFVLIICLAFSLPVLAQQTVLQGSVMYNVESARKYAFDGLDLKIDKSILKPYLYDENNEENKEALKTKKQIKGRYVMSFSLAKGFVNGYVIVYEDKPQYAFYYSSGGYLVAVDIDNKSQEGVYPYKIGKYNPVTGNLISIGLYISEDEQYAFSKNGKLKAHWVGDTGYNAKGKPIAKRSVVSQIPE